MTGHGIVPTVEIKTNQLQKGSFVWANTNTNTNCTISNTKFCDSISNKKIEKYQNTKYVYMQGGSGRGGGRAS